jgi:hypothetical protein
MCRPIGIDVGVLKFRLAFTQHQFQGLVRSVSEYSGFQSFIHSLSECASWIRIETTDTS